MVAPARREGGEIRRDPRAAVIAGFAVIGLAVAGFAGWAATAPLASAVIAPAVVAVDGSRKQIQHLEGGIVREILVRDGARVSKSQVLLRLDDTRAKATLGIVRSGLNAALVLEARLIAERAGTKLRFPRALTARAADAALAGMMRAQAQLVAARRASIDGQRAILRQRIVQFEQEIGGLKAQLGAREARIALIEQELVGLRDLLGKSLASALSLRSSVRQTAAMPPVLRRAE
jgi:membrane fusion protein, type I secretion system